jgi:hypothetical protein
MATLTEVAILTEVLPCFFLSLQGKCQGKTRKDWERPALFQISCYFCSVVICVVTCIDCV